MPQNRANDIITHVTQNNINNVVAFGINVSAQGNHSLSFNKRAKENTLPPREPTQRGYTYAILELHVLLLQVI